LETEEADILIRYLQDKLGNETLHFYTGVQYRHLLVIKGGKKQLRCVPPHDVPGTPFRDCLIQATEPAAEPTAKLLNELIIKSQELLATHPLNVKRMAEGKDAANSIWPWGGGYRPNMIPLQETFPQIHSGVVITAVDLIRGIGRYAGLEVVDVNGATGLYDTNYEGKAQAAIEALQRTDFVYLHVEASDEAGHEGDVDLKLKTIEDLDRRVVGPIMEAVKDWEEPVAFAVLPDHPTPCAHRTHTSDPVPFAIWFPGMEPDAVQTFDEMAAKEGAYGVLSGDDFIRTFMNVTLTNTQ
jgi:2,3-bisphosphoglycerate-independent phosphoglycerate mutase